ncbi:uncharacterized protein K489DRAFT_89277 [Dissoconium aciculare CBS 342.82]|uniref:Secreted protein n=1 Tax=Dissoconium aciculare CBS 342.82 TaxID=1314786 RepID=A0A6J3LVS6_9PEZI|nr:uncharacterized protein K489DRAFT_89277 [Dissoconium aciculare CBS 342.82]KAF1818727.1 hypothetical protein K489DRAFT_89277 [Dissoconium aciculare CBS 342.82]
MCPRAGKFHALLLVLCIRLHLSLDLRFLPPLLLFPLRFRGCSCRRRWRLHNRADDDISTVSCVMNPKMLSFWQCNNIQSAGHMRYGKETTIREHHHHTPPPGIIAASLNLWPDGEGVCRGGMRDIHDTKAGCHRRAGGKVWRWR